MKVVIDESKLILFLNKNYIRNLNFTNQENATKLLKKIMKKLKKVYNIEFNGYYDITIYIDYKYGAIIEIIKEEFEYFDYLVNQIELNTKIVEDSFLYENDDIINDDFTIYKLNDKFFLEIKKEISDIKMGFLLETSTNIVYGKEKTNVKNKARIVRC